MPAQIAAVFILLRTSRVVLIGRTAKNGVISVFPHKSNLAIFWLVIVLNKMGRKSNRPKAMTLG